MTRDPLAAFDAAAFDAVAFDAQRLRRLARRHQETVRENPGVDDIVYEWRRAYPHQPLVERTDAAYYLLVEPAAWREFGDALGLDGAARDALRALHARQFAAVLGEPDDERREPMVLTRP
ncbi:MAG: hypothetical protein ABEH47_07880 [Haloferacaceae archaeon]